MQMCNGELVGAPQFKTTISYKFPTIFLIDIDECAEGINGCIHSCSNTEGNYTCSCNSGYRLASDNHGCEGMYSGLADSPTSNTV